MPPCSDKFCIFSRDGVSPFWQAGLELLTSDDPLASASQSSGNTGVSYYAQPIFVFLVDCILPCWPGWSQLLTSGDPPVFTSKVLGLQVWVTVPDHIMHVLKFIAVCVYVYVKKNLG